MKKIYNGGADIGQVSELTDKSIDGFNNIIESSTDEQGFKLSS